MKVVIIPRRTYRILSGNKATPFVTIIIIMPIVRIVKCKGFDLIAFALNDGIIGNLNLLTISSEVPIVITKIKTSLTL